MKIHVRYFASLREVLGDEERVVLDQGGTVGSLRDHLLGGPWFDGPHWDAAAQVPVGIRRS